MGLTSGANESRNPAVAISEGGAGALVQIHTYDVCFRVCESERIDVFVNARRQGATSALRSANENVKNRRLCERRQDTQTTLSR